MGGRGGGGVQIPPKARNIYCLRLANALQYEI